jgi:aryl-alcohol dehydrogenase-like predicted oxidoreductase
MEMREFGGTGIRASVVGLGCNNFGLYQNAAQAVAVVRKALDVGINFFNMAAFATMEANCSIWVRDAEKAIIQ